MQKTLPYSILGVLLFGWLLWSVITWQWWNSYLKWNSDTSLSANLEQKVYVANEWDSTISIIDPVSKKFVKSIVLSEQYFGKFLKYSAHNVQVGPRGSIVAVTANILEKNGAHGEKMTNSDEIILIDPNTDSIIGRIPMWMGTHLTHVVINSTDTLAYAASQEKWQIFVLDLATRSILKEILLPEGSEPHGLRLSKDDAILYIAMMGEKSIGAMNTRTYLQENIPIGDAVVQVAVTSDGKYVLASLYTTKSVARYEIATKKIDIIPLPNEAKWPVQIYSSPDSQYLYVADQWFYFGQPTGDKIYKIDIPGKRVVQNYTGWQGPHGVVVSLDGKVVYVTNLLSNNVTVIDTATDSVIATIPAGEKSNGISIWTKGVWGTP